MLEFSFTSSIILSYSVFRRERIISLSLPSVKDLIIAFFKPSFYSAKNSILDNSSIFFEAISKLLSIKNKIENSII